MVVSEVPGRRRLSNVQRRNLLWGLLFISPWIVGLVAFHVYPIGYSLYLSFTNYSGLGAPEWTGIQNYIELAQDPIFWTAVFNTLYYVAFTVPISIGLAIVMALAMNQQLREVMIYRAALYLPSVLPIFGVSFIFITLLNPHFGLVDYLLRLVHIPAVDWLGDPHWAKLALVGLAQLGLGNVALIFLAGLRAIPITLYEAAEIDGAGWWRRFWSVTLPLLTPLILYNVILSMTQGLQVFQQSYILTGGGPDNSTLFFVYYLYNNAFTYSRFGYASAMSWLLFVFSFALAFTVFRVANRWVNYELVA